MAKKPIIVTIRKEKHKTQPFVFEIDKPGPAKKETKRERYTRKHGAMKGALRMLDAVTMPSGYSVRQYWRISPMKWFSRDGREIIFVSPEKAKR